MPSVIRAGTLPSIYSILHWVLGHHHHIQSRQHLIQASENGMVTHS